MNTLQRNFFDLSLSQKIKQQIWDLKYSYKLNTTTIDVKSAINQGYIYLPTYKECL